MDSPPLALSDRRPVFRQIAEAIRGEILHGKLAPGARLPPTEQLAADWRASRFTVYTAMRGLVKEGLVERQRGTAGSYVADPKRRFACAGIYHAGDIFLEEQRAFGRRVHISLLENLARMKIESLIFIDPRPYSRQATILPSLAEAILHRRIQCLIAPTINQIATPAWSRLALPTTFSSSLPSANRVLFDIEGFFEESIRRLAAQGCESIGIISNVIAEPLATPMPKAFYEIFRKTIRRHGLTTREEWIRKPRRYTPDSAQLGYKEFKNLWQLREKPQGLIIHPDIVVRGSIIAILEAGINVVPPRMKFVFHRNAHIPFLCPFPVTWGITDEDLMAEELVRSVLRQFKGEKRISPVKISYIFQRDQES